MRSSQSVIRQPPSSYTYRSNVSSLVVRPCSSPNGSPSTKISTDASPSVDVTFRVTTAPTLTLSVSTPKASRKPVASASWDFHSSSVTELRHSDESSS